MNEIESAIKLYNIIPLLESPEFLSVMKNKDDNQIIEYLKASLNGNIINELKNIDLELLNNKLIKLKQLSETSFTLNHSNRLYYYKNCKLINKSIVEIINQINKNFSINLYPCFLDKSKIASILKVLLEFE